MAPPTKGFKFVPKTFPLEWEPILGINVKMLIEKAPNLEQLEVLESTSKSLLPTSIQKDNGKDCLDRMVHLAKVLQLGLEYQSELAEQNTARLELELDNLQQDLRRAQTGDSEAMVGKLEREIEDLNGDLREAYKKMDGYEAELDDLRDELAQRATEGRGRGGSDSNVLRREVEEERAKSSRLERQVEFLEGALDHERQRNERSEAEMREEKRSAAVLREKAKQLDDEVGELRTQLEAEQKRMEMREMDDRGQNSRLQQKNREIDRLQRENKLLERQFVEIQAKSEELAAEMLQLSEQVVRLDEGQRERDATIADMEALAADAEREKAELMGQVKELQGVAAEKMALLDEFEKRFAEQYREWEGRAAELAEEVKVREDEANALREELERWHRDASGAVIHDALGELAQKAGDAESELGTLQQQLRAAQEKEVLLLEAYEQLEKDQEKELAAASARQKGQLVKLEGHNRAKEAALEADRARYDQLDRALAEAQIEKEEALSRLADYEAGVYGLAEAMRDVKRLKKGVKAGEEDLQACLGKLNHRNQQLEDLLEENRFLRQKAGVPDRDAIDLGDFKLKGQVEIEQLRALNAQLEKELAQLEDERRELKTELRYRAKYHGEAAAKMGLTAKQLVALEEYSNKLRFGKDGNETDESEREAPRFERVKEKRKGVRESLGFGADEMAVRQLRTKLSLADVQNAELRETVEHLKEESTLLMKENLLLKERVIGTLLKVNEATKKASGKQLATTQQMERLGDQKVRNGDVGQVAANEGTHVALEGELTGVLQLLRTEVSWQSIQLAQNSTTTGTSRQDGDTLPEGVNVPRSEYERTLKERLSKLMDEVSEKEVALEEARARAQRSEKERDAFRARLREQVECQLSPQRAPDVSSHLSPKVAVSPSQVGDRKGEQHAEEVALLGVRLDEAVREAQVKDDQLALLSADFEAQKAQLEKVKGENAFHVKEEKKRKEELKSARARAERELEDARAQLQEARSEAAEWEKATAALRGGGEGDVRQQLVSNVKRLTVLQVRLMRASRAAELAAAGEIEARERLQGVQLEMEEMEDTLRQYHWFLEKSKEEADARAAAAAKELAASVPRKDHLATVNQLLETQQKLTENLTDKTQLVLAQTEADRVKEELGKLKAEAEKVEKERAILAEKCAQLDGVLREIREGELGDAKLREEVVALRVSSAHAQRRAEMAAQERMLAESVREGAEKRLRELEGQVTDLAKQLHEAHEDCRALRASAAGQTGRLGGAEPDLRARIGELEAEARKWRQSAEALQSKIAQRDSSDLAVCAEREQLRAAVRELGQASDAKAEAAKLHERVARARAKEITLARQVSRAETTANRAREELLTLRQQLDEKEARLCASQGEAHAVQVEQQRAIRRLESALVCQIDGTKAAAWSAELLKLAAEKKELSLAATCLKEEVQSLQCALEAAQGELARQKSVDLVLKQSVPEVYRQNVALGERELQLKLGVGRLERQLAAEKERVGQLEKAGAESEEKIAQLEEAALREKARLEEARDSWRQKAERCESDLLAVKKERDALNVQLRMERSVRKVAPSAAEVMIHGEETALLHRQLQELAETAEAHRRASSEHLDALTRLKYECQETDRQLHEAQAVAAEKGAELRVVQQERDALVARLHDRLTSAATSAAAVGDAAEAREGRAAEQVAAVAQATISRLQGLLSEKETAITTLREALVESRRKMLEQQERDRHEIGRLNEALFLRNEKSIQDMRTALHDVGKRLPAGGNAGGRFAELTFEELKRFAGEKEEQIEALQQGLREWEARYKDTEARLTFERDSKAAECAKLQQDIQVERARAPSKLMESLVAKLKTQLGAKESKLQHMKDAIKQLESRLISAMQANAEAVLQQSSGQTPEQKAAQAVEMREKLRELNEKMERMKEEVLRCRQIEQEKTAECQALKEEIFKEKEAGRRFANELHRTKSLDASKGDAEGAQTSKPSGSQILKSQTCKPPEQPETVAQLKENLKILAVQNKRLQKQLSDGRSNGDGHDKGAASEKPTKIPRPASAGKSKEISNRGAGSKASEGVPNGTRTKRASSDTWPQSGEGSRRGLGGFDTVRGVSSREKGGESGGVGGQNQGLGKEDGLGHEADKENAVEAIRGEDGRSGDKELGPSDHSSKEALASWQEQKKAARRLDLLRTKLAQSKEALAAAEEKVRWSQECIAQLERERDKHREKVRALEAARRDYESRGPKLGDAPKIKGLTEALEELERENERLRSDLLVKKERQLAELRRKLGEADGTKNGTEGSTPGVHTSSPARTGIGRGGSPRLPADGSKVATWQELQECRRARAQLEDALLERDNSNLELRFEKEQSLLQLARAQRRLKLLFDEELGPSGSAGPSPSGTPRGGVKSRGKATPRKEQEMEGVIEALKKVAEKLRAENEALRKASHSNVKYMEMLNKNRDLRKRVLELEAELEGARRNSDEELLKKTTRLQDSQAGLRSELRKARDENQELKLTLEEARGAHAEMEAELASAREARARAQPSVPEDEFAELERACREQEEEIGRLRSELSERSTAAEALARQLADAEDELDLLHGQQTVRNAVGLEQLAAEVTKLRGHVADLEAEREELLREARAPTSGTGGTAERDSSSVGSDVRRLTDENRKLRAELNSYGPAFFQEVEELKADHHELIKLCDHYETLLREQAQQTGRAFTPGAMT